VVVGAGVDASVVVLEGVPDGSLCGVVVTIRSGPVVAGKQVVGMGFTWVHIVGRGKVGVLVGYSVGILLDLYKAAMPIAKAVMISIAKIMYLILPFIFSMMVIKIIYYTIIKKLIFQIISDICRILSILYIFWFCLIFDEYHLFHDQVRQF
jgi:hypothetical protein